MSDQYSASQNFISQYGEQPDLFVTAPQAMSMVQVNQVPLAQEIQVAGQKILVPRMDTMQKLQMQVQQLQQELQLLKAKHVRLQQQHVNLASQVVQLQRMQGAAPSYE